MTERIKILTDKTLKCEMHVKTVKTDFDRTDLFLPKHTKEVKRICEYVLNQEPVITEYQALTGFFKFDGSVVGDPFNRGGHKHSAEVMNFFYLKKIDNLSAMDWQHATADFSRVLEGGIAGIIEDIDKSIASHTDPEKIEFLTELRKIAECLAKWAEKCSERVRDFSKTVNNPQYKRNLEKLADTLLKIPYNAPSSFYEAILAIYICFSADPDSFGLIDRYLTPFYENDIKKGILTKEEAKEYLQELFLMVQTVTRDIGTRGAQSHFCIGGRDAEGKDCYNEVSQLVIESMMELPTYIPQVTFRWTNDTPKQVLRFVLDCERKDEQKRIAITNDDRRIEAYTKICGFPYEVAVNYTLVGCNEPAMLGGMCASASHANMAHPLDVIFHSRDAEIIETDSFEAFYKIFKDQLYTDLDKIYHYDDLYNLEHAKDDSYIASLFFNGCIENGTSLTKGVKYGISNIMFLGNVNVIDSLAIVKQFVFDEKRVSMTELINAVKSNWSGYENLRTEILKKGKFFGNDDETSNFVATLFYEDLYNYVKNKKTALGYSVLIGDHTGYNEHFKWFGEDTKATPDGRYNGEPLKYGISQIEGKDRNGLTALLNSISKFDVHGISSATVTNLNLDKQYKDDDEYFEKTLDMLEAYLKNGGIQFQLNYVSYEELTQAQEHPELYSNLRVRVTGFSEYFNKLSKPIQDSVIKRYEKCE